MFVQQALIGMAVEQEVANAVEFSGRHAEVGTVELVAAQEAAKFSDGLSVNIDAWLRKGSSRGCGSEVSRHHDKHCQIAKCTSKNGGDIQTRRLVLAWAYTRQAEEPEPDGARAPASQPAALFVGSGCPGRRLGPGRRDSKPRPSRTLGPRPSRAPRTDGCKQRCT